MSVILQLTPHDPIIARDSRPFGAGQGNRMRGLPWPLPSVVAGSFRTALVKSNAEWDFSWSMFKEKDLKAVAVHGLLPVHDKNLYLTSPNDCVWDEKTSKVFRVQPIKLDEGEGVDFPDNGAGLMPVRLSQEQTAEDFKAKTIPTWWPVSKYAEWLSTKCLEYTPDWFKSNFFGQPVQEIRDHVKLDPDIGAAAEGQIFSTTGLNISHMPRFGENEKGKFKDRFAEVSLSIRVNAGNSPLKLNNSLDLWHPLGGERRLVHWQQSSENLADWTCPTEIRSALETATKVRMVLTTPAIFQQGWKPDLEHGPLKDCGLTLVGASVGRWKAVSGWSLAQPSGPKAIRRMVPAGSVYFFEVKHGDAGKFADRWLESVSDDEQEQRDGFGLAIWGTW